MWDQDAYARTFPKRQQTLIARGASSKDISSYVAMYNKNKLVNRLMEQVMVPVWVLNQDAHQMAIRTQLDLMLNAKSEMVRMQAANSLMFHLRPPEQKRVYLTVSSPQSSGLDELRGAFKEMAHRQRELIGQGVPTAEIAQQKLPATYGAKSSDMFVQ